MAFAVTVKIVEIAGLIVRVRGTSNARMGSVPPIVAMTFVKGFLERIV